MPRNTYDATRIRFATGAAGGVIAYRPNDVLVRRLGGVTAAQMQVLVNLALDPDLAAPPADDPLAGGILRTLVEWLRGLVFRDDDPEQREQQLNEIDERLASYQDGRGIHVGSRPRLRLARTVNDRWSVFVPEGDGATIDPVRLARVLRAAGLTAQPNYVRFVNSLQSAPNYIAPNYIAPNYIAPNYIAPNYIAPNYIAPNYIAPNYIAPNYIAPNYIASGPGGGACACEPCQDAPHVDREVPMITARGAYGPLPGPAPTKVPHQLAAQFDVEIHVLDVRFQSDAPLSAGDSTSLKAQLRSAKGVAAAVEHEQGEIDAKVRQNPPPDRGRRSGLLPLLLRATSKAMEPGASDADIDAAMDAFLVEPRSAGLGANVDADAFIDPTTNHAEFIQGIVDRIVVDEHGESIVRHHAIAGTLGDVSDEDLARSIDWVVDTHTPSDGDKPKLQVMNLSLSGYTDDDLPPEVLDESIEAAQQRNWLIVASAGNNGSCRLAWPAALQGVVSVAAYGPCGPAFFSNHGPWVDACGPGVGVVSNFTKPKDDGLVVVDRPSVVHVGAEFAPGGEPTGYASWSGTSFSAPYVAAMLVLRALKEMLAAAAGVEPDPEPEDAVATDGRVAPPWKPAVRKVVAGDDLIRFPGYGTIVSSEAVSVTQQVAREQNAP